jgi:hypothetical protein
MDLKFRVLDVELMYHDERAYRDIRDISGIHASITLTYGYQVPPGDSCIVHIDGTHVQHIDRLSLAPEEFGFGDIERERSACT